jgi:hypothetical protein
MGIIKMKTTLNEILAETASGKLLSRDERLFVENLLQAEYEWDFCYDENAINHIKKLFWRYQSLVDDLSAVMHGAFTIIEE